MINRLFFLVSDISIVMFFVLGISFIVFPFPKDEWLKNYKISVRLLTALFFMMGLFSVIMRWFDLAENAVEMIPFSTLIISTIQVVLFSVSLITLFNPWYARFRVMLLQIMPILVFTVIYIISSAVYGDPTIYSVSDLSANITHPTMVVRMSFFAFFLLQLSYYSAAFFREMRLYRVQIEQFYSDTYQVQLSWVRYAFFYALALTGVAVTYFFYDNPVFHVIFVVSYTAFYFLLAMNYLRYTSIYKQIKPAILKDSEAENFTIRQSQNYSWPTLKQQILTQKSFLRPGITIEDLARELNVPRKILSAYINSEEKVNYNGWINQLRIEEAKSLLLVNPDLSLSEIAGLIGFTELSNFSRQFKLSTNISPSVWRQNNFKAN